ncbi:hypothetical protein ACI0FM_13910 [Paenochrobactrum sp. BZR 588]|uniref:hypothetical protein n=1 Tax=Paenochrobactrum TaxID=999488 RepID=UPI0035BC63AE
MSESIHPPFRFHDLKAALCLMLVGAIALLIAMLSPTGVNYQYGVVMPLWSDTGETLAMIGRANGEIISINDKTGIALVYSDEDDFVSKIYEAGAWLVFEPLELGGCISFGESYGA